MRGLLVGCLLLGISQATALDVPGTEIHDGQCTADSHIAEGGVNEDLTKRQSRYFCDSAVISSLNRGDTRFMIQFSEKRAHHNTVLGFAGHTDKGILELERVYLEPNVPTYVTDGHCRLFFRKDTLTDILCGAEIIQEDRKTVVVVRFQAH
jgi:hypothetical protein